MIKFEFTVESSDSKKVRYYRSVEKLINHHLEKSKKPDYEFARSLLLSEIDVLGLKVKPKSFMLPPLHIEDFDKINEETVVSLVKKRQNEIWA